MCKICNNTGKIVYGSDTESGRRETACACRKNGAYGIGFGVWLVDLDGNAIILNPHDIDGAVNGEKNG